MALLAVINHFREAGKKAVYVTMFDLISYIQDAYNNDKTVKDDGAYSRLLQFANYEILAIDEFDKMRVTEWVLDQITKLIDQRHRLAMDEQTGTLIAMNGDPIQLPDWIYSRLSDGRNRIICNHDNDLRPHLQPLMFDPRTHELIG